MRLILFLLTLLIATSCEERRYPVEEGFIQIWMYNKEATNLDHIYLKLTKIKSVYDTLTSIFNFEEPFIIDLSSLSQSLSLILSASIPFGKYVGVYFVVDSAYFSIDDSVYYLRLGINPETGEKGFSIDIEVPIFIDETTDLIIGWYPDSSVVESLGVYWFIPEVDVDVNW